MTTSKRVTAERYQLVDRLEREKEKNSSEVHPLIQDNRDGCERRMKALNRERVTLEDEICSLLSEKDNLVNNIAKMATREANRNRESRMYSLVSAIAKLQANAKRA